MEVEFKLFADSIADTISFFDPTFDFGCMQAVMHLAAVHDDIAAMPMGYHGLIGDMGGTLVSAKAASDPRSCTVPTAGIIVSA
nr:hypothetical protein [Xanthomonas albilineans]